MGVYITYIMLNRRVFFKVYASMQWITCSHRLTQSVILSTAIYMQCSHSIRDDLKIEGSRPRPSRCEHAWGGKMNACT